MTDQRYKEIRQKDDFIYLFYLENGGDRRLQKNTFPAVFSMWVTTYYGLNPVQGIQQVKNFFDKKFNYKLAN